MTHDIETLRRWLLVVVIIASVGTTLQVVLYSFSRWWQSTMGRLFMLQSLALTAGVDMTLLFQYWHPKNILVYFWFQALIFTGIAGAALGLSWFIFWLNILKKGHDCEIH